MNAALDGPRLPASAGRASGLVVFLHGYGADGNDLIELGRQWRALLPEAAFVSPHAPERCAASPMGRQWFALANSFARQSGQRRGAMAGRGQGPRRPSTPSSTPNCDGSASMTRDWRSSASARAR